MATVTKGRFHTGWSLPDGNQVLPCWFQVDNEANLDDLNDIIEILSLPKDGFVIGAGLRMGRFDDHATPTCTFSLILTT